MEKNEVDTLREGLKKKVMKKRRDQETKELKKKEGR